MGADVSGSAPPDRRTRGPLKERRRMTQVPEKGHRTMSGLRDEGLTVREGRIRIEFVNIGFSIKSDRVGVQISVEKTVWAFSWRSNLGHPDASDVVRTQTQ
jgi:hypothetical protein